MRIKLDLTTFANLTKDQVETICDLVRNGDSLRLYGCDSELSDISEEHDQLYHLRTREVSNVDQT